MRPVAPRDSPPVTSREVLPIQPRGLRPAAAAHYLGVGITFLQSLPIRPVRLRGNGPMGKPVVIYLREDLDALLDEQASRRDPAIRTTAQKAS